MSAGPYFQAGADGFRAGDDGFKVGFDGPNPIPEFALLNVDGTPIRNVDNTIIENMPS